MLECWNASRKSMHHRASLPAWAKFNRWRKICKDIPQKTCAFLDMVPYSGYSSVKTSLYHLLHFAPLLPSSHGDLLEGVRPSRSQSETTLTLLQYPNMSTRLPGHGHRMLFLMAFAALAVSERKQSSIISLSKKD